MIYIYICIYVGVDNDELEFNYVEGSPKGPENWGKLKPEWATCSNGKEQSPITLARENVEVTTSLGNLERNYTTTNAVLRNRGYDIMVRTHTNIRVSCMHGRGKDIPIPT